MNLVNFGLFRRIFGTGLKVSLAKGFVVSLAFNSKSYKFWQQWFWCQYLSIIHYQFYTRHKLRHLLKRKSVDSVGNSLSLDTNLVNDGLHVFLIKAGFFPKSIVISFLAFFDATSFGTQFLWRVCPMLIFNWSRCPALDFCMVYFIGLFGVSLGFFFGLYISLSIWNEATFSSEPIFFFLSEPVYFSDKDSPPFFGGDLLNLFSSALFKGLFGLSPAFKIWPITRIIWKFFSKIWNDVTFGFFTFFVNL